MLSSVLWGLLEIAGSVDSASFVLRRKTDSDLVYLAGVVKGFLAESFWYVDSFLLNSSSSLFEWWILVFLEKTSSGSLICLCFGGSWTGF